MFNNQRLLSWMIKFRSYIFTSLLIFPLTLHASFIESTIGTAVVNDATATYFNPAALTVLKKPQIIGQGTVANFHAQFTGQSIQTITGFTQSGNSSSTTHYYLPSLYIGVPTSHKFSAGLAIVANSFRNDFEENSILRYVQSNNNIRDIDIVPAIGIKLNDKVSIGAGINFSHAKFVLNPTIGFPNLNIPDSQSHNVSRGNGVGGDFGILYKISNSTLIGFNYRSAITYRLNGESVFEGTPHITSNNYHFKFWTPARNVFSMNHFVTPTLGFIGTIQYIQWSIIKNINFHGIATRIGPLPVVLPDAKVPYHLHNTWVLTLGNHYRVTPKWILRFAGTYDPSPSNGKYQISNGDSIIVGTSTGYEINKNINIDGSYAHAFIKNQNIHITSVRNIVNGVNKGFRDSVSLKLTFNIV